MSDKPTLVSGIQPTGNLHIGNYLGAVKNWVDLQNSGDYNCIFFIADYHTLTVDMGPKKRRDQILRTASELIAAGIDPDKSLFFVQSHVQEHTELKWIFDCVTNLGQLKRMTQFKNKTNISETLNKIETIEEGIKRLKRKAMKNVSGKFSEEEDMNIFWEEYHEEIENLDKEELRKIIVNQTKLKGFYRNYISSLSKPNTGLLTYPVLQAADILLYHGERVPVGEDQVQHLELTRDIARKFNNRFDTDYFPEAEPKLTETPRVKSLREPESKMSKSKGKDHVIELADSPEVIEDKMMKAVTATEGGGDEIAPGVENLLLLLDKFGDKETHKKYLEAEKSGDIKYGYLKQDVAKAVADYFEDFRKRRSELMQGHDEIAEILIEGSEQAQEIASDTIEDVREIVGVR